MEKSQEKVIVIGGGAAGMMAAGRAAQMGASVTLIERNKILGKKILISGKGRCNVTNAGDIEDLIANFPNNGKFLYGPFYTFTFYNFKGKSGFSCNFTCHAAQFSLSLRRMTISNIK